MRIKEKLTGVGPGIPILGCESADWNCSLCAFIDSPELMFKF
jgi:hypothetical protein